MRFKKPISYLLILSLCISLFLPAKPVYAWNSTGHRVIGAIAWEYLTPIAREKIIEILKSAPADSDLIDEYNTESKYPKKYFVMNAGYWPDIIRDRNKPERNQKYHRGNWHYIGTYWKQTQNGPVDAEGQTDDENIVERISTFQKTLSDPTVSDEEKAIQIAWILHLIGDIHMPLHNTSRVTEETPDGDRGGNSFRLGNDWPRNLHAYWDGIIDIAEPKSEDVEQYEYYTKIAKQIILKYPASNFEKEIAVQSSESWNVEGQMITRTSVYPEGLKQNEMPSERYLSDSYKIAEKRIALSGYRTAKFLNDIFDK